MSLTAVFDPDHLASVLGTDDPVLNLELYELFLTQIDKLFQTLVQQREAGDWTGLRDLVHRLKSSAHSVGALALAARLADINGRIDRGDNLASEAVLADLDTLIDNTRAALQAAVATLQQQLAGVR